jgi:methyl-accepting chemotaxis protein
LVWSEISGAANEQSGGTERVNHAVVELDRTTQRHSALVEKSTATSVREQTGRLTDATAAFRMPTV